MVYFEHSVKISDIRYQIKALKKIKLEGSNKTFVHFMAPYLHQFLL